MKCAIMLATVCTLGLTAAEPTRGPGVYPGAPSEYSGPALCPGGTAYRNLALHRPAYHSSSYDYNLTAQLVTDGIKETTEPRWLAVSTSDRGTLPLREREILFDQNWVTAIDVKGRKLWVQVELGGGAEAPAIDRIDVDSSVKASQPDWENWTIVVSGSADGRTWQELQRSDGMARPTGELKGSVRLAAATHSRFLRIELLSGRSLSWHVGEIGLFHQDQRVQIAGPHPFSSAWMSAAGGDQWVSVDLGAVSTFDRVVLDWLRRPAAGRIEVSDDGAAWKLVQSLPAAGTRDDLKLAQPVSGRYVRVAMSGGAAADRYSLSEFEVHGRGGLVPEPKPTLDGGIWRVQRDSQVSADARAISTAGFADRDWIVATVPGTVLVSYLNAGAIPDRKSVV
jgi:hypothetical protein